MKAGDIKIDYKFCIGCKKCYDLCPLDVFGWNESEGLPIVEYPLECWHCGLCERECPETAVEVDTPFHQKIFWRIYPNP